MTKKEIKKTINKEFYKYVTESFPDYYIDNGEGGGRVYLIDETSKHPGDDSIMFHQSEHYLMTLNWASDKVKRDCEVMENYLKQLVTLIESKAKVSQ